MAYIGNSLPANFQSLPAVQRFNGNASTTAFTLAAAIANDQSILVSVDGVVQDSNAYSVSGTTLTFTAAPSSGTGNIFVNTISPVGSTITHPASDPLSASTGTFSGALSATTGTFTGNLASTSSGVITNSLITSSTNQYAEQLFQDGNAGYALQVRSDNAQSTGTGSFLLNDRDTGSFPVVIKEGNASNTLVLSGSNVLVGTSSLLGDGLSLMPRYSDSNTTSQIRWNRADGSGTGSAAVFQNNSNGVGSINYNNTSTSFNTSSDYRLKENIDYTWDATTRLKQLKPARFNFIADDTNTLVDGFIAHEVSSIVPEAITGTKDAMTAQVLYTEGDELPDGKSVGDVKEPSVIDPQGIDQSKLVPLLVKTIQELEARITALEA
jgi:hypothetical protein